MAETIYKVDYFAMDTAHKAGEAAHILEALSKEGVDLLAFTGFPSGRRAQVDFIPRDSAAFKAAARRLKLKLKPKKTVFLIQGEDRPGVLAGVMSRLAGAGINVTAVDAACAGEGRFGAILWVQPRDVNKAAKTLGAV